MDTAGLSDDDPLKVYLRELDIIPPMSREEETDLLRKLRTQKEAEFATRRLIETKLSLVVSIVERHSSAGVHILDLIQKGNEGLMFALKTFSETSSDASATHAAACIEEAVSRAIAESPSASG